MIPKPLQERAKQVWTDGIAEEAGFWQAWIGARGGQWRDEFAFRMDPASPLRADMSAVVDAIGRPEIDVLDVGAGPATLVGKRHPVSRLRITAVDPLADEYNRRLDAAGVAPPVRTSWCHGELLLERFARGTFDLAIAINSLDHAYDPPTIILNMLEVVRPGGFVYLIHGQNEAVRASHDSLHQWNFDLRDGAFVLWTPEMLVNLSALLGAHGEVKAWLEPGKRQVHATVRKR